MPQVVGWYSSPDGIEEPGTLFRAFFAAEVHSSGSIGMHEIQLRRPWHRMSEMDRPPLVVDVPDSSAASDCSVTAGDQVMYQRGFNSPTGLTGEDMIGLCIGAWQGRLVSVQVNGTLFAPANAPLVLDLSKILLGFNKIEITLVSDSGELPRIIGDVVLRIQQKTS
ncbi:MAG: hypothetical protein CMM01_15365 [Rhodopirellula sp.]|nr:hypothetical protein [Rhodopirellula sp.]OUX50496.1 MAG: hypothetical protein CBE43_07375 [Rhodopirellula sp. TMED283]